MNTKKIKGTIIKINEDLGYGFVKCGKEEVFFVKQDVDPNNRLVHGDKVLVTVEESDRGLYAVTVSPHKTNRTFTAVFYTPGNLGPDEVRFTKSAKTKAEFVRLAKQTAKQMNYRLVEVTEE